MNQDLQERLSQIDNFLKTKRISDILHTQRFQTPHSFDPKVNTSSMHVNHISPASVCVTNSHQNQGSQNQSLGENLPLKRCDHSLAQKIRETVKGKKEQSKLSKNKIPKAQKAKKKKDPRAVREAGGEKWIDASLLDWPENDFRIFCGNLGKEVTDEILTLAFKKYPSFSRAKVIRDNKTSNPRGYGFVSLLNGNDYLKAMKEINDQYIGNRRVKLTRSTWKKRSVDDSASKGS